jgi:dipeptidyl aminopeptidase/acylaminoacyl peptidase
MRKSLCCLFALYCLSAAAQDLSDELRAVIGEHEAAGVPPVLTRASLVAETSVQFAELSPDGRYVASGIRQGITTALSLLDTNTLAQRTLVVSDRIRQVQWASDSRRLYLELDNALGVLPLDASGKASYVTRLDRVADDYFVGADASSADHVLVVRQRKPDFILERISSAGEVAVLLTTDRQIDQVIAAAPDELYVVLHDTQGRDVYRWADGELSKIVTCGVAPLSACDLLAWSTAQQSLWLNFHGDSNFGGLYAWSPTAGITALHEDPLQKNDLAFIVTRAGEPLAAAYDFGLRTYGLDAEVQAVLAELHARLPASLLRFTAGTNGTWLVREDNSIQRESRYYLFDAERESLQPILAAPNAAVVTPAPELLSRKHAVEYIASDGATIPAYITFPKGVDIASAPLVAAIHGGPWSRVAGAYNSTTQMLANRGYIVFEPNFRASSGYGLEHVLSANREFGNGRVQQDITDGVRWLLAQGIGNADNVAIVGGSFGGFSVLSGLAFTPSLYKVGVAVVPPADLAASVAYAMTQPSFVYRQPSIGESMKLLLGDFDVPGDRQALYARSPLASLDTITAPLLVVAGADDDRIDIKHVKDYALQLFEQGNAISMLIDEDEGHGLLSDAASEATLYLMEEMLALYLGGRTQGLDDAVLHQYLQQRLLLNTNPGFLAETEASPR